MPPAAQPSFDETLRYFSSLPAGLRSFPECMCNADSSITVLEDYPALREQAAVLPAELARAVAEIGKRGEIPDVLNVCLRLMAYDVHFRAEAPFLAWTYD